MRLLATLIAFALILSVPFISEISATATSSENTLKIVAQQDDKVRVIITFKDTPKTAKDSIFNTLGIPQQDPKEKIKDKIKTDGQLKHEFQTTDSVSATITQELLDELNSDPSIAYIEQDRPVQAFLSQSVPLINADQAWQQQMQDTGLTGKGTTVCVIDTGIDYTHQDLGNCTVSTFNLNGVNESHILESAHNYTNNFDHTWSITKPGYTDIAVYFRNISLEYKGEVDGSDTGDRIIIYDGDMVEIAVYHGIDGVIEDLWTPYSEGDTIYIRLVTDSGFRDYGFYIDSVLNGTTDTTYDWSNCSKTIGGWDFVNGDGDPIDDDFHGTHVAGIIAADGTVTGVAPDTGLIAVKTLDAGGTGWFSDTLLGIEYCINNSDRYNISVISMSLGAIDTYYDSYCDGDSPSMSNAINTAVAKNISVIIASGNNHPPTGISYPACIENATRVGSTSKSDVIENYTQRSVNFKDLLLAPGGNIYSTMPADNYATKSGTSMATPHVSGATAILVQAYQDRFGKRPTPAYIEYVLNKTGILIYDSQTGLNFSRIDVLAAVLYINTPPNITDIYNNITEDGSQEITINETDSILFNLTVLAPVNYTWKKNGTTVGANQSNWTFDTTYDDAGFWIIEAIVNNDNGTRTKEWNVTIDDVNRAPTITSISNITMDLQDQITINISANISDPDSDTLTITTDDPGNITVENHTLVFHYTENVTDKPVTITVNDSDLTTNITIYINITDELLNITDTYNNITGDNSSTLTINETDSVFFNISTDVPVNYTWYINDTNIGNNFNNYTLTTGFDDAGTKNISVNVSDNESHNTFRWTVTILNKNRQPIITTVSNISMELQNQTTINISGNISDPDNDNLTITTDDQENITIENHTLIFNYTETVTDKPVTITVNDSDLTTNITIYINITDTTAPTITIDSPTNKTYNTTDINISINADEPLDWCAYSLNAQPNITMNCTENSNMTAIENLNNLTLWANDTSGNLNRTEVFFTVDTISPNITITALNYTTDDYLYINLSVSETPDTCILNWQDENITMNRTGTKCDINKTSISPGIYNYTIYVNDTVGNTGSITDLQSEIYYCFVSVTDWTSCVSSSRTRIHTYRDCTTYTETESCHSSSGGGSSSFSFVPLPVISNDTLNETLTNITDDPLNDTETDWDQNDTTLITNRTQDDILDSDDTKETDGNKVGTHTISDDGYKDLEDIDDGFLGIRLLDDILFENSLISKIKDRLGIDSSEDNTFNSIVLLFTIIVIFAIIGISYNFNRSYKRKHKQKQTLDNGTVLNTDDESNQPSPISPKQQEIVSDLSQKTYLNNTGQNNNDNSPKDVYLDGVKYKE